MCFASSQRGTNSRLWPNPFRANSPRGGCPICGPRKACTLRWQSWPWGGRSSCGLLQQICRKLCFLPSPWKQGWTHPVRFGAMVLFREAAGHVTSVLSNTISRAVRTYELRLMLQKHDSLCVAKECGTFPLSRMVQWSRRNQDVGVKTCLPGFTRSIAVKCGAENPVKCFQCVRHEVALCLLKCQEHRVLQKRCSSRAMSHTHATQNNFIGAFATLTRKFTRTCLYDESFSQIDVVCLPRPWGAPPLAHSACPVPILLWCMERACRTLVIFVTP